MACPSESYAEILGRDFADRRLLLRWHSAENVGRRNPNPISCTRRKGALVMPAEQNHPIQTNRMMERSLARESAGLMGWIPQLAERSLISGSLALGFEL